MPDLALLVASSSHAGEDGLVTAPVQGFVPANLSSYPTSEISDKIVEYREGRMSFAQLVDELGKHDYAAPSHYRADGQGRGMQEIDEADHHEVGTTGELRQARSLGLLTDEEYEEIVSSALRAHGA